MRGFFGVVTQEWIGLWKSPRTINNDMATYTELFVDQGSDFTFNIDLDQTLDLSNYTAIGKTKPCYASGSSVDFQIVIQNNTDPELVATLTAAQTLTMKEGRHLFDIEIRSSGSTPIVTRVLEGMIFVSPSVSSI